MPNAKGFFPEDHPQYVGIYWGEVSSPQCQAIVDWADLIVAAGAVFNDYTTVGWSAQPARGSGSSVPSPGSRAVRPTPNTTGVALAEFVSDLAKKVEANAATARPNTTGSTGPRPSRWRPRTSTPTTPLSRVELWRQIEQDLDSKPRCWWKPVISWLQRHVHPATRRRQVRDRDAMGLHRLVRTGCASATRWAWSPTGAWSRSIGDGSFQLTAQEVSNMIRHRPRDPDLLGQQPRIRDRIGDP